MAREKKIKQIYIGRHINYILKFDKAIVHIFNNDKIRVEIKYVYVYYMYYTYYFLRVYIVLCIIIYRVKINVKIITQLIQFFFEGMKSTRTVFKTLIAKCWHLARKRFTSYMMMTLNIFENWFIQFLFVDVFIRYIISFFS